MAHFNPNQPLRIPCAGRGCEHYIIGDDQKEYCTFWRQLYGKDFEVTRISCPKCM